MSSRSSDDLALKEKSAMTELEFLQRQMTPMVCILLAHKIEPRQHWIKPTREKETKLLKNMPQPSSNWIQSHNFEKMPLASLPKRKHKFEMGLALYLLKS